MRQKYVISILLQFITIVRMSFAEYKIGVGIADCTGPAGEITFMGYAKPQQKGCGIHLRQYSRAFIFDDGQNRAVFVSVDAGMIAHGVQSAVIRRLSNLYNDTYMDENVILSGTHTHSTPGGFMMDFMYDFPNFGFVKETFDALVQGITLSIVRAHRNMVDGRIYLSSGELLGVNINRSPTSYLQNPEEERLNYKYNVDKEMVQLKLIKSADGSLIGAINWYPIHPTSMNNTNCLITSDNVGYASVLLEKMINKNAPLGQRKFVGAFASSNLGDVSPNVNGPRCINTGEVCHLHTSTCDGNSADCIASGPGRDMFESTKIAAEILFNEAKRLLETPDSREVTGPIKYIQQYVDMPSQKATISLTDGTTQEVRGCLPAMGYSFAAGTTDGPGEPQFHQGTLESNLIWDSIRDFLFRPTIEDMQCHYPKPILLNTGRISVPYQWQPRIVSTQLIQLGEVVLIAVPGEFTTMSGRRLRNVVKEAIVNNGGAANTRSIIAGLSNVYSSYVATPEEYQVQRYEGASTIFGPHTLTIYLKIYQQLAKALATNQQLPQGPHPPNLSSARLLSFNPPVIFDTAGIMNSFGDVLVQPPQKAKRGTTVSAIFISGHPRNNLMHEKTFLTIEKLTKNNDWSVVATDADWETKFIWSKVSRLSGGSKAEIVWEIPKDAPVGVYRIRHFGHAQTMFGGLYAYTGTSHSFLVQ